MKFTVAAILSAVASAVYAQTAPATAGVSVNLPSLGQVLNAGTTFKIQWTVDAVNPSTTINTIALMKGGSSNLDVAIPNILSAAIPVNPPTYDWNIPATVETNPSYVLVLTGSNNGATYSTYFTIMGAAPGTSNNTTPAAPSAVPSPGASGAAPSQSGAANSTKPNASGSASPSPTSAASSLKAGLVGAAGVAGAVALLL